jgi:hypothetical protein
VGEMGEQLAQQLEKLVPAGRERRA